MTRRSNCGIRWIGRVLSKILVSKFWSPHPDLRKLDAKNDFKPFFNKQKIGWHSLEYYGKAKSSVWVLKWVTFHCFVSVLINFIIYPISTLDQHVILWILFEFCLGAFVWRRTQNQWNWSFVIASLWFFHAKSKITSNACKIFSLIGSDRWHQK